MYILMIGTYPPKQCGIATFSADLTASLRSLGHRVEILAVSDAAYPYTYPAEVIAEIRQEEKQDYIRAAQHIAELTPDVVLIQHEYGIYGGRCGEWILELTRNLAVPYCMVAHTVLENPDWHQFTVLQQLSDSAQALISMNQKSCRLLETLYRIPPEKLVFIPHGVPEFPPYDCPELQQRYHLTGKQVISTFGLLGPGKGLELGIRAFARIAPTHPQACYLILGQTHPMLVKTEGEAYRKQLTQLVQKLHLENQIQFVNCFLSLAEIGAFLRLSDVYFSPYPNLEQSVSGTMAFAIGCGRAIVSTPYAYAVENLSGGAGLLSHQADAAELGGLLAMVLDNPTLQRELQYQAALLGQDWQWSQVAQRYVDCLQAVVSPMILSGKGACICHAKL